MSTPLQFLAVFGVGISIMVLLLLLTLCAFRLAELMEGLGGGAQHE